MTAKELTVTVDCHIGVPVEQAERALKIVEWFLNDNADVDAIADRQPDGTLNLHFERRKYARRDTNG